MRLKGHQQFFAWVEGSYGPYYCVQFGRMVGIIIYIDLSVFKSMLGIASFDAFETGNSFLKRRKICPQIVQYRYSSRSIFYIVNSWNLPCKFYRLVSRMKVEQHPIVYNMQIIRIIVCFFIYRIGFTSSADMYAFSYKKLVVFRHQICKILKAFLYGF